MLTRVARSARVVGRQLTATAAARVELSQTKSETRKRNATPRFSAKSTKNTYSRFYSAQPAAHTFKASDLTIERTKNPKPKLANDKLLFGRSFTDHMLEIDWDNTTGWTTPKITPYHNLSLDPSASVFHYALECFEGMKAYKDKSGKIRMFRPMENMKRMNSSCARLSLPTFPEAEFLECIKELVRVDESFIPVEKGFSLYIRPTMISTSASLGVHVPRSAKLFVLLSPVGPYYPTGFKPVSLFADPVNVRAWPGGTGGYKVGSNYAGAIMPALAADQKGYSQILWLLDDYVTEVGTMNFFMLWKNEKGETELITPSLDYGGGGIILPGVTRKTILELTRQWGEFKVTEGNFKMADVARAVDEGRVLEAFGAGTAAIVSPIERINYKDRDYKIPLGTKADNKAGELAMRLSDTIMAIQYGEISSPWSVVVSK